MVAQLDGISQPSLQVWSRDQAPTNRRWAEVVCATSWDRWQLLGPLPVRSSFFLQPGPRTWQSPILDQPYNASAIKDTEGSLPATRLMRVRETLFFKTLYCWVSLLEQPCMVLCYSFPPLPCPPLHCFTLFILFHRHLPSTRRVLEPALLETSWQSHKCEGSLYLN